MRTLVLYSSYLGTARASYYNDWLDAFMNCRHFDVTARNIVPPYLKVGNPSKYRDPEGMRLQRRVDAYQLFYQSYTWFYAFVLKSILKYKLIWDVTKIAQYDLVVLLHSTNADSMLPLSFLENPLKNRRGKLLIFVGNEYCLMPEKLGFIRNVEADFIASQLPYEAARWLYSDCDKSRVLCIPHALNPSNYSPSRGMNSRKTDVGFIGDEYSYAIGDTERSEMIRYFLRHDFDPSLKIDIRFGRKLRLPRNAYSRFLCSIRATIGAESGTYYLEKTDRTQKRVEAFTRLHPETPFNVVYANFFDHYPNPVNGKAVSSRHFEPIGTKTCQILLEGRYNDILKPDEHYISLQKDFSNIDEVMERFKDEEYVANLVERAYEYVADSHTYDHRVRQIWNEIR
jgi:hypothetical protein